MPRIAAATVREHRAQMQAKLVDAAEQLLREGGSLTAGGVAAAAGIARNSLYRYVDSVDDLRILVLNKHLPSWTTQVGEAVALAELPRDKVVCHVEATLREAAPGGHAWLMRMADQISDGDREGLADARRELGDALVERVHATGVDQPGLVVEIIGGILQAGFARLEAGDDLAPVVECCARAAGAVLDAECPSPPES